tara:strand:- start:878 stop:1141 length:264 start_codon:yes stop_codon:yes gene_type:complete
MWVFLNEILYNLNHVVSITLPKGSDLYEENMYYFNMIFKDGSDERFWYEDWDECRKEYEEILKNTGHYYKINLMQPIRGKDLANNKE